MCSQAAASSGPFGRVRIELGTICGGGLVRQTPPCSPASNTCSSKGTPPSARAEAMRRDCCTGTRWSWEVAHRNVGGVFSERGERAHAGQLLLRRTGGSQQRHVAGFEKLHGAGVCGCRAQQVVIAESVGARMAAAGRKSAEGLPKWPQSSAVCQWVAYMAQLCAPAEKPQMAMRSASKPVFSMFPQDQHGLPDFPHRGGGGSGGALGKGGRSNPPGRFSIRIGGIAQDKAW